MVAFMVGFSFRSVSIALFGYKYLTNIQISTSMFKQNQNYLNNAEQKNNPKPTERNPPKHTNKHRKPDSTNNLNQKHLKNKNRVPKQPR